MRRLMLLRHAKSDRGAPGVRDHDRTLNARGREAAPRIGAYMASHGLVPDLVICSTATRARETWDLAATSFRPPPKLVLEQRIYENDPRILLDLVRTVPSARKALLLVGHNPSFQSFADVIVASGHGDARQRLREKFPTAALAVIDFAVDGWDRVHPHSGRLDRLITPRLLETSSE
jgi:phosphohistidine phosphatase